MKSKTKKLPAIIALTALVVGIGSAHAMSKCKCTTGEMEVTVDLNSGIVTTTCSNGGQVSCTTID